ncbi:glycerol 3-phosphate dehydrogenase (NAD(P)+) [Thermosyntropha lipolytica DSM 11003]|uniref:Glycerol-3-phosphate dehydrogenase [NAD(P)+] n=1 Tax=Thermosyntropha lipolytica DSM 11003 TaxID=1123382 RepID=A0A1M5NLW8_9FIRM|nr:NAD(P)H-dependent glycerol-3-phosphate dehydrogenase [Thermosyntropha lipolytica]SHG90531.1 glycerol 3-phosphate dehydrogenase (NAD(P)+) [Thermosyntropha lipolytica DSM 11003]
MRKACVLGAGSWGTAQALLLSDNIDRVVLWGREEDGIESIKEERENKRFLPGIKLPSNIEISSDMAYALYDAELAIIAVPAQAVRGVVKSMAGYLEDKTYLVNTAKGIEIDTGMRMSQVVEDVLGGEIKSRFAVLSGPSHAEEVARKIPTVVTVASFKKETAFYVQDAFMTTYFRVYTNPDVAGVELGGALKNIIALAAGIVQGLNYGDNTKAALITRGLTEITRMGIALGGDARTFSGLSGIGDLIVTCGSRYSRNLRAGELIARGYSLPEVLDKIGMVVEGVYTTRIVYKLAAKMGIDMPITQACYNVLYEGKKPEEELNRIMSRQKKHEIEEIVNNIEGW